MKMNDRKIRKDLLQFSAPAYDRDKMQETVRLSKKVYNERLLSKQVGFWEFIVMQMRFIGRWVWLLQAALLLVFLYLLSRYRFEKIDMQPVFLLFSSIAPLVAFIGFPEILKSYAHNMEEIETCTRFSMRKLMGARMLILGLTDLCSLTIMLAVSTAGNASLIVRMILYLFVPFNLTCCACMTVLDHVRNRYAGYYCGAACVICTLLFSKLSFEKHYYETAVTGAWIVLFAISIVYLTIEIVRVFQNFNCVCFLDETLPDTW
jgi:hypothetical protein